MKKVISMLLVLACCLSLCACGDTKIQTASIGETVSSDRAEFILKRFEFGKNLYYDNSITNDNFLLPIAEDELTELPAGETSKTSEDGKVFLSLSFSIENIGKTPLREFVDLPDGSSTIYLSGYIELEYDGYLFRNTDDNAFFKKSTSFWSLATLEMDVMAPVENYVGYITVPEKVMTDTETPLYLRVYLPNEAGKFETYTYKLR